MRPDERELDDEIRGHLALSIKERIERGEDPEAARLAAHAGVRLRPADARLDAARLAQPLVRRGARRSAATCASALRSLRRAKGLAADRRGHARARHRRQRRDLQRRPRRAAAAAGQPRRRSPDLHPAERARPRQRRTRPSRCRRSTTSSRASPRDRAFGDFSTIDFTMIGLRRAARGEGRRRQRLVSSR